MRQWYKFELWDKRILVHVGITTDPLRSRYEHGRTKEFTRMKVIGNRTTHEAALKWREKRLQTYRKNHHKQSPRYTDPLMGDFTE